MSKWTVFAYAPDLYGNVDYGIQKDNYMTGQAWRNKETAELIATAWNGDDKQLAAISETHAVKVKHQVEMKALLEEMVNGFTTLPEYQNSLSYWRNRAARLLKSMEE